MRWLAVFLALPLPALAQDVVSAPGATLRALDKVAGTTRDIDLRVGDTVEFGRLSVSLADCRYPAADPSSNAYAELIILEPTAQTVLFDGWMVASSPALSALDHPRYDIWVLRCAVPEAPAPEEPAEESDETSSEGEGG